ncbi:MAG TPA: hypothetical protein VNH18_05545, partial [Bryobacteraceae bacterium]|nr:hypothetical protein [Bryobacteraceae bacterium]
MLDRERLVDRNDLSISQNQVCVGSRQQAGYCDKRQNAMKHSRTRKSRAPFRDIHIVCVLDLIANHLEANPQTETDLPLVVR